jgi:hypothetical protein
MEAASSSKILSIYQAAWRQFQEDHDLHIHGRQNLESPENIYAFVI